VGSLRWRPPQPVIAWNGVRKADAYAIPCAQGNGTDPNPSGEDCLYLNVWTQTPTAHAKPNLEPLRSFGAWFRCAWGRTAF
jgi:para-nitrobenzyl esterase